MPNNEKRPISWKALSAYVELAFNLAEFSNEKIGTVKNCRLHKSLFMIFVFYLVYTSIVIIAFLLFPFYLIGNSAETLFKWLVIGVESDGKKKMVSGKPPLSFWVSVLGFVFPRKVFANIFAQAIADAREEHAEVLSQKKFVQARWIEIRSHGQILTTVVLYLFVTLGKKVAALWKLG